MKKKKLIFGVLFAGVLAVNTLVLSTTNKNDLQLNSLFTLAWAQTEDGEDGETVAAKGCTCTAYDFDHQLLYLKTCIPFFWTQKLKCDDATEEKCCKASDQKPCSGTFSWPPNYF